MATTIKVGDKVMLKPTVKGEVYTEDYLTVATVDVLSQPYDDGSYGVHILQPIADCQWWNSEDLVVVEEK